MPAHVENPCVEKMYAWCCVHSSIQTHRVVDGEYRVHRGARWTLHLEFCIYSEAAKKTFPMGGDERPNPNVSRFPSFDTVHDQGQMLSFSRGQVNPSHSVPCNLLPGVPAFMRLIRAQRERTIIALSRCSLLKSDAAHVSDLCSSSIGFICLRRVLIEFQQPEKLRRMVTLTDLLFRNFMGGLSVKLYLLVGETLITTL